MPETNETQGLREPGGASPRCIALVGPQGTGKTTLLEALLAAAGTPPHRRIDRTPGHSHGRPPGTELRLAHATWMGDPWALLDCPGAVEFQHEANHALAVADLALLVCEPSPAHAALLNPLLYRLEQQNLPAMIFINRMDMLEDGRVRDTLAALQEQTPRKLVLRQVPIREGGHVTGYVDVVNERAYRYRRGLESLRIQLPAAMREREQEARGALLEALADHDDGLLEKLLEDVRPEPEEIYRPLHAGEARADIIPVLIGAAEHGHGVRRLWKALRHDAPGVAETAARLGIAPEGGPLAQVFRTQHAGHAGRLSYARVWRGTLREGTLLDGARLGGLSRFPGGEAAKVAEAVAGDVVALHRMESALTGATLGGPTLPFPPAPEPVYELAITLDDPKEEVRLSAALQRLAEEDRGLVLHQDPLAQTILAGQGEQHLRHALERLTAACGVKLHSVRPQLPYRETIRRGVTHAARLKRQTGGHGQFADVKLHIEPAPRGSGFRFEDKVVGGAVPRRFIPAVAEAAELATRQGPLGHPVVDIVVTLLDGSFHSVDSSDMAFANATRIAMADGLGKAEPVLLEPVDHVTVLVPAEHTPAAQRLLTGRRGHILGYAALDQRPGWDEVEALVPQAELQDLITELRGHTRGLGTHRRRYDHLAEVRR